MFLQAVLVKASRYTAVPLSLRMDTRVKILVKTLVGSPYPPTPPLSHRQDTGSLRDHRSPEKCCNADAEHVSYPTHCRGAVQSGSGAADMGTPYPNSTMGHPESKCGQQPHHIIGTATVYLLVPKSTQCNSAPSMLRPDLCRAKYLSNILILLSSPTGTYTGNTQSQRFHRTSPPTHFPIIFRPINEQ